jgi:hypothetical protein
MVFFLGRFSVPRFKRRITVGQDSRAVTRKFATPAVDQAFWNRRVTTIHAVRAIRPVNKLEMTEILAFILGAAIPSVLLWFKTKEAQGLLDELLRKEGRRPLTVNRQKSKTAEKTKPDGEDTDQQLVSTINPSPIDRMMQEAIDKDSKEFKHGNPDKDQLL